MKTREWCFVLAAALLAACSFDGSGTEGGGGDDDDAVDATTGGPPDARPIDASSPSIDAPPAVDALFPGCDLDQQCESGEDPAWCPDCGGGGGFVCDFDQTCDAGESEFCPDCTDLGFECDFDQMCETGESDECLDCLSTP